MSTERPPAINAKHLVRKAVIYVRQSSAEQVETNRGSTESQRNQRRLAEAWGWPPDLIHVLDEDLGLTGSAPEHRLAYKRMVDEIRSDRVGAVFLSDFSRGGRDSVEWLILLGACRIFTVVIVIDGRAYDLADPNVLFMSQLQALLTEQDSRIRNGHLERGRIATLRAGRTLSQPPAGYLRLPSGDWIEDPDPSVRDGVHRVFRAFFECRSLRGAVALLRQTKSRVPRRPSGHPVRWIDATVRSVQTIITNPVYTGDYVYGRRRSDLKLGRDVRGRLRTRKANAEEIFVIRDHHPPYVSREEFQQIQDILAANRWNDRCSGGLGRGHALLQGLMRCGLHRNGKMSSNYKSKRKDGRLTHGYHCIGDHHNGGRQCGCRPGAPIDAKVVAAALHRLSPLSVESIRDEWRRAKADALSEQQSHRIEQRRLENEHDHLLNHYLSSDPHNVRVRAELERRLEEAKTRLDEFKNASASIPSAIDAFDEASFSELTALSRDLRLLWDADTTTNLDRKEILRTLIESVVVESFDSEKIVVTIRWIDAQVPTSLDIFLPPYAHRLMSEWNAAGLDPVEIACRLNERQIPTKYLTRWTSRNVERALHRRATEK